MKKNKIFELNLQSHHIIVGHSQHVPTVSGGLRMSETCFQRLPRPIRHNSERAANHQTSWKPTQFERKSSKYTDFSEMWRVFTKNEPKSASFLHVYHSFSLLARQKVKILEDLERLEADLSKSSRILIFLSSQQKDRMR